MKKILNKVLFITSWLLISNNFAQVTEEWIAIYNGPGNSNDNPTSMAVDDSGNVYVTGESGSNTSSCITTVKYNSSGVQQWVAKYFDNGNGAADAHSLKLDRYRNVYVTGGLCMGSNQNKDIVTLKYNSAGIQQWVTSYHTSNTDGWGCDLIIDSLCNVYVTGSGNMTSDSSDFITIKYNPAGIQQWAAIYNGPTGYIDFASKILGDGYGNLYVKGISWVTPLFFEYTIVKYNNNGVQQWVVRQFGSDNTSYYHGGLTLDRFGNIYMAASIGAAGMQCYLTAKYNSSGNIQWMTIYNLNGLPSNCETSAIVLDFRGNVYVTGYSYIPANLPLQGCTTIKYNSEGAQQWVKIYNGNNYTAAGTKIAVDSEGSIYVLGNVDNGGSAGYDYFTLKYDSLGTQQWLKMYNGPGGNTDIPTSIIVDNFKNVYVTGRCGGSSSSTDFATIKYSQPIGIKSVSTEIPVGFKLYQNYPNPFNPNTKIRFEVPAPNLTLSGAKGLLVKLRVFDILGREIEVLVNEQLMSGTYETEWNASNYTSGVYFYILTAGKYTETKRMILLK